MMPLGVDSLRCFRKKCLDAWRVIERLSELDFRRLRPPILVAADDDDALEDDEEVAEEDAVEALEVAGLLDFSCGLPHVLSSSTWGVSH